MSTTPTWIWYELMTSDPAAALAFYQPLVGWRAELFPGSDYQVVSSASGGVGGVMKLPDNLVAMHIPPHWMGVIAVPDVDAAAAKCTALGGRVNAPPFDIPNVGRYAVLADPTGAAFAVMTPMGEGTMPSRQELGRFSWNELWTDDPDAAWAFYQAMFGWVETGTMDMGGHGTYRMYGKSAEDGSLGGIARRMPDQPVSAWMFYVNVPDAGAALAGTRAAGGRAIMGPQPVPDGGAMGIAMDPQGAVFAVYSHGGRA